MFVDHAEHLRLAATIAGLEIPDVVMPDARGFTVGQLPLH